ncbi:UNVERIFIED_CONTAM: hypothetical protein GTU68_060413 [Idotea baltica]|nr:hypothetical protein [Idotea baltica]
MLSNCNSTQELWNKVNDMIDQWLRERQQLIQLYNQLLESSANEFDLPLWQSFCALLVDYTSIGHFEIYEQLISESKVFEDQRAVDWAIEVYPRINAITQSTLSFNDLCDKAKLQDSNSLLASLVVLDEQLSERFELEDSLIEVLHKAHK